MKSAEATRPNVAGTVDSGATAQLPEACDVLPLPPAPAPPDEPEEELVHQLGGAGQAGGVPTVFVTCNHRLMDD